MKITTRDLVWLTAVLLLATGWFLDRSQLQQRILKLPPTRAVHPERVAESDGSGSTRAGEHGPVFETIDDTLSTPIPPADLGPFAAPNEREVLPTEAGEDGQNPKRIPAPFLPLRFEESAEKLREHLGQREAVKKP